MSWWRRPGWAPQRGNVQRFIEIRRSRDGEVLASVRSVWVALDAKTLRPRQPSNSTRFLRAANAGGKIPTARDERQRS